MSPTISILSTLLLSLISGSMVGGQRMDSISLQQSLQYWWKIYKSYSDEVTLGYCWASYLYKISEELSAKDLFAPSSSATWDLQMSVGTPKNQPNLLPQNVTAKAMTPLKEEQSHENSTVSKLIKLDPDKHRVASRSKMIQRRRRWTMNETEPTSRTAPNNYSERNSRVDENERIASIIDYYAKRRRRALSIVPEVLRESPRDGHEFSSRGTSSHAVNPTPNPRDDDKVDFESADPGEEDSRRKVLRSLTSHRDSSVGEASHSFSLKVTHGESPGDQPFPFRRRSSSRKRNSRVDEVSSDSGTPLENHGIEDDPAGPRDPLNNDGSSSTSSQFRRVNAEGSRMSVVKLMDSKGNSSRDPTINSQTPRRMPEELSHDDSLLSPRRESAIAERSFLESRGSGEETVKRDAFLQFKMVSHTEKRHSQRSRQRESSRNKRDVSTATIHPFFSSEFRRSPQQVHDENHELLFVPKIPQESRKDDLIRIVRSAISLLSDSELSVLTNNKISDDITKHDEIFNNIGDYKNLTNQSTQHSKHQITSLPASQDPNLVSLSHAPTESFLFVFMRTLRMFVQVGQRVIDNLNANPAFVCLKDYSWSKFVKWMDGKVLSYSFSSIFK